MGRLAGGRRSSHICTCHLTHVQHRWTCAHAARVMHTTVTYPCTLSPTHAHSFHLPVHTAFTYPCTQVSPPSAHSCHLPVHTVTSPCTQLSPPRAHNCHLPVHTTVTSLCTQLSPTGAHSCHLPMHTVIYPCTPSPTHAHDCHLPVHTAVTYPCTLSPTHAHCHLHVHTVTYTCVPASIHSLMPVLYTRAHCHLPVHTVTYTCTLSPTHVRACMHPQHHACACSIRHVLRLGPGCAQVAGAVGLQKFLHVLWPQGDPHGGGHRSTLGPGCPGPCSRRDPHSPPYSRCPAELRPHPPTVPCCPLLWAPGQGSFPRRAGCQRGQPVGQVSAALLQ